MNLIRLSASIAVAVAAGTLSPSAQAAAPSTLGGVNVISAGRAGYVDVRVPRAVTLATPFGGGEDIAVAGGAPLAAFVLVGTDAHTRGVTIAGGATSVNGDTQRFLMPVPQWPMLGGGTYEDLKTYGDNTPLPAGAYRLYAVASGRSSITLRLRGLTGHRALTPARLAVGSVAPADHELSATPVKENVFAASNNARLGRRGFALQALQTRLEAEAAWQVVMCHNNPAELAEPLRDTPGCPAGEKHTLVNHRYPAVEPDTKLFVQAYAGLPPGEHGLSTVYTSESRATALGYSTLWLEY